MKHIINFYYRHKKLCTVALALLVVAIFYAKKDIAFAAENDELNKAITEVANYGSIILKYMSAIFWPVILMIGSLLDNDLIFGGAMGERLLSVWVQIRNLVNIVFVLILLAIAVYNVLGLGEEGGLPLAFKTILPKFVLALIAVNFSFLAVKVILDFTNVIAGAVFALPVTAVSDDTATVRQNFENSVCGVANDDVALRPLWCTAEGRLNAKAEQFFSRLDKSNVTLFYAFRFGKPTTLKFVREGLKDITQLGFNIIFNTVLFAVYATSYIALFLVLLFRLVALWIAVVLSPLIAVSIVLPNLKDLMGGEKDFKTEFINNAIVPIKIGLVLSVGYIMLSGLEADKANLLASNSLSAIDPNSIPTDITDLQQLLIAVGSVVIIWSGVFSAAKKSAAEAIVGKIEGAVSATGKRIAMLPTFAQVIPIPGKKGGDKGSLQEMLLKPGRMMSEYERKGRGEGGADPSALQRSAESGNARDFARTLKGNTAMLGNSQGIDYLRKLVEGTAKKDKASQADKDLHAKISHMTDAEQIVREIYESRHTDATVAKAFRQEKITQTELLEEVQKGRSGGAGGGAVKKDPTPVTDAASARRQLAAADVDETKLANDRILKAAGWTKELIDEFRKLNADQQNRVNLSIRNGQLFIDSRAATESAIRAAIDAAKQPASAPQAPAAGGGGAAAGGAAPAAPVPPAAAVPSPPPPAPTPPPRPPAAPAPPAGGSPPPARR